MQFFLEGGEISRRIESKRWYNNLSRTQGEKMLCIWLWINYTYLNIRQEKKVHGDGDIDNAKRKKD